MALELNRRWAKFSLNADERLRLYRKIAKMLGNGLPLLKVLEELEWRASREGRKPNEPLAIVLSDWRFAVQNGQMLSEAMHAWVPATEQMIVSAGEQAGRVEAALVSVTDIVLSARRIRRAISGGVAYPVGLLVMMLGYLYLFGTRVIPKFALIADPEHWHGAARSLYVMSLFVQSWMLLVVAVLAAFGAALALSLPRWRGPLRIYADRVPPYSIYRLVAGSGFLIAFAALQGAGVTVERALLKIGAISGPWLRERIDDTLLGVKSGLNAGEALHHTGYQFPSREIVEDLCIYAEYGGFDNALKTLADEWLDEGVARIAAQMRVLNGVAIVVMAIVIGWLVTGFFGIQQEIAAMTRAMH
ncbi:type II secretion system F family protein [Burkholderia alba]|uniref:type II secretion system F family protein n=1 Tax=Burkholderia alba TaxID=2683677 RepID=UPI002B051E80|nr:type II secretion system F family protein [Burkholderia alba]